MSEQNIRLHKVKGMLATEYKEEEIRELFVKEGEEKNIKKTIEKLKNKMHMTIDQALDFLEIPQVERAKYKQ